MGRWLSLQPETAGDDGPTVTFGLSTPNGGAEATLVSSAAGAAGALAGWAISSIGKKASVLSSRLKFKLTHDTFYTVYTRGHAVSDRAGQYATTASSRPKRVATS